MKITLYEKADTRELEVEAGGTLYSALNRLDGILTDTPCGSGGRCGKCRVIARGALTPPDADEARLLGADALSRGVRLACRTRVTGDCEVMPYASGDVKSEIQVEGVRSGKLALSPVDGPDGKTAAWGLAVDIGTTTVAVYLCDLKRGAIAATDAFINPQRVYGADVISRLGYIIDNSANGGAETLQSAITDAINRSASRLALGAGISAAGIGAAVITGNTVMEHIAAGRDARGIANAPFTVSTLFGYSVRASEARLLIDPRAKVYYAPCFSGYVGGDIATGIVASDVDISTGCELFIDIGTNGEMALGNRLGLCLCATAAGPAFEGAHIECGMGGVEGSVNEVSLDNGNIVCHVIGGGEPRGICGSGLIDAVAVMLDCGAVDETGRLAENFYLDAGHKVYISPKDIRELQLAKAAVCGGILTLLDDAGLKTQDISRVVLAGGFGAHINRHSACRIGLLPPELEDKIFVAGNTAGMGAVDYLLSGEARERIHGVNGPLSRYLELSGNEFFMDAYIEQMMFE